LDDDDDDDDDDGKGSLALMELLLLGISCIKVGSFSTESNRTVLPARNVNK
jgi:hypothetical protein